MIDKKIAQGLLAIFSIQASGHPKTCVCRKSIEGVATNHFGKTEEQFNEIIESAHQD